MTAGMPADSLINALQQMPITGLLSKGMVKVKDNTMPKSDRNKLQSVQGYRGISLLSIPGKCLEKLVTEKLNYFLETAGHTPPQQYGFTAGKSTVDAKNAVSEHVSCCRRT